MIDSNIDLLEKRYGGVTGYLKDALGIGNAELHALREKYLCDPP